MPYYGHKIGSKQKGRLWVHGAQILEVIFVTLTDSSSVITNDTQGTWKISTPPEIAVRTHFHGQHGTKTIPVFLPTDGEVSWLLLPSLASLVSDGTVQPENNYSCNLKVTGQIWENQKRISMNNNHSHHQHPSL